MLNSPKLIDIKSKHLRIFLGNLRQSSEIFGKVWKMFENIRTTYGQHFWKSSEIVGKSLAVFEKSSKTSLLIGIYNKQNNTCLLGDMKFIFSFLNQYLTEISKISIWTLKDKFHIYAQPCITLYITNFLSKKWRLRKAKLTKYDKNKPVAEMCC